jgi:hypothetical protein
MGRPKKPAPRYVEPDDISQEEPGEETEGGGQEGHGFAPSDGETISKSAAARAAIDAGYDKPATAVGYIKNMFGVEIGGQHFSAIKSQYLKAQAAGKAKGKPGRKPREAAPLVEGYVAPPTPAKKPAQGDGDLMLALEGVKELVGQFGAERVKKMVDLLS